MHAACITKSARAMRRRQMHPRPGLGTRQAELVGRARPKRAGKNVRAPVEEARSRSSAVQAAAGALRQAGQSLRMQAIPACGRQHPGGPVCPCSTPCVKKGHKKNPCKPRRLTRATDSTHTIGTGHPTLTASVRTSPTIPAGRDASTVRRPPRPKKIAQGAWKIHQPPRGMTDAPLGMDTCADRGGRMLLPRATPCACGSPATRCHGPRSP